MSQLATAAGNADDATLFAARGTGYKQLSK
jgi:hypothetical protein